MLENKYKAFKTNDIRGLYPTEINEKITKEIGKAIVFMFKPKVIIIGRDKRKSSPSLFSNLVEGIISQGCDVIDIGFTNTPLLYYSVGYLKADFGIMITASHNPGQYNGFKLVKKEVLPSSAEEIQELKRIVKTKKFKEVKKKGRVFKRNISEKYISKILSYSKIKTKLKVVVDTGNGMSGTIVPKVFSKLPISCIYINRKINMINPEHEANPLKTETLKGLQKAVLKNKADLGMAFDGDGDRIGFVDERGKIVPMEFITSLLSEFILKEKPNSKIMYDVRSSKIVKETILASGGVPIEYKVGHSLIKRKMREIDCEFAGEISGHYYFPEFYYSESPVFLAIVIMNAVSKKKISQWVSRYKKYYKTPEINYEIKDAEKKIKALRKKYSSGKISNLDGLKVEYSNWWFNVRGSHTEPLLRLNLEANNKELMKKKLKEVEKLILS